MLPAFYLYITRLPEMFFYVLLTAAGVVALWEFLTFYGAGKGMRAAAMAGGALMLGATALGEAASFDLFALALIAAVTARLFLKEPASALKDIAPIAVALIYIPGLLSYQVLLRQIGPEWIIFLYAVVWASDSLAFYIGSGIGKRKLYPAVSPKKTVEGAAGSLAGGVLASLLMNFLLGLDIQPGAAAALGLAMGAMTVVGDLVESMFKRDAGVKDSSLLIPGHGGILDKLDGVLFTGPLLYWGLYFILP